MPSLSIVMLAGALGLVAGAAVDRAAVRWRPPAVVAAAMGAVATAEAGWPDRLPVVGWLRPLLAGRASRLTVMRAATELIGALAFAALAVLALTTADPSPLRLLLRAALIADLLLILRIDWQYHLIQDRTILAGVLLALAAAASTSTAALVGAVLAGLGAALVFFLFYLLARLIYRQAALGFGDVLLAGLIGVAVGPAGVFGTLFWGMVLASCGGLLISLTRRTLRTYFAYGAYLAAVTIGVLALPGLAATLPGFF
jgi:leader peptidase (prepilin peptidase)/N-methyltransferase